VFDRSTCNLHTPKAFEQSHRDAEHSVSPDHDHFLFTDDAIVPQKWREHLRCRHCKQQLVVYLGEAFLTLVSELLFGEQKLVIAGCYKDGKAMGIDHPIWCAGVPCIDL